MRAPARLVACLLAGAVASACAEPFPTPDGAPVHPVRFEVRASGEILADGERVAHPDELRAMLRGIGLEMRQVHMTAGLTVADEWLRVSVAQDAPFRVVWPFLDACMTRSRGEKAVWKLLVASVGDEHRPLYLEKLRGQITACGEPLGTWRIEGSSEGVVHVLLDDDDQELLRSREPQELLPALPGIELDRLHCGDEVPWSAVLPALEILQAREIRPWPEPVGGDPFYAAYFEALGR